jgi:hypothetical protein
MLHVYVRNPQTANAPDGKITLPPGQQLIQWSTAQT